MDTPLFNNKDITFKRTTIFFPECIKKNILLVGDVVKDNQVIPYVYFRHIINTPGSLLIYNCIKNALSPGLLHQLRWHPVVSTFTFSDLEIGKLGRKFFYTYLNETVESHVENLWERHLGFSFSKLYWLVAFNSTTETRLHVLHWKILMNLYPTGSLLFKMKIRQSELCANCNKKDSLIHFFFECSTLNKLWKQVKSIIFVETGAKFILKWEHVLLGVMSIEGVSKSKVKQINHIILLAKLSISKAKFSNNIDPSLTFEYELSKRNI